MCCMWQVCCVSRSALTLNLLRIQSYIYGLDSRLRAVYFDRKAHGVLNAVSSQDTTTTTITEDVLNFM